jgi:Cu-processing system permease protein
MAFTSLAFFAAVSTRDKARGIGLALMIWFYFSILYDGLVLGILFAFNDYPLEKAVVALASLNPIDLGRIIILLKLDISALMGYTGAVYKKFFGSSFGLSYSLVLMLIWIIVPLLVSLRIFNRKNL